MRSLIAMGLLLASLACSAAEVAGVKMPDTVRVGGQELVLNGAGLRAKAFVRIYVAGLYLPARAAGPAAALALKGPARLSLAMLRDVTAQQLIDALVEGIRENHPPAEVEALKPQMETLSSIMRSIGVAKNGSVVTLDYVPGTGTQVGIDNAARGAPIAGDEFYRAILRIWLGNDPVDSALKRALLGSK